MVISLVNDAPKKLEDTLNIMESDPWLKRGLERREPNAGGTRTRFKRREFGELIARIETEAQSEYESWVNNYHPYSGVPANARALVHDNDAAVRAGVTVSGTVTIGSGVAVGNIVVIGGGVAVSGAVTIGGGAAVDGTVVIGGGVAESGFAYQPGFRVVTRIRSPRGLPSTLEQRLERFKGLPEGWDSYGARAVGHTAIGKAKTVILEALSEEVGIPAPFVSPTTSGGVGLEWKLGSGKELLLEISLTGDMSYLLVEPRLDGGENEVEDHISNREELKRLLLALRE